MKELRQEIAKTNTSPELLGIWENKQSSLSTSSSGASSRVKIHHRIFRLLQALVVLILLFGPYLANLCTEAERFGRLWHFTESIQLLLMFIVAASLAVVITEAIERFCHPRLMRLWQHVFVLAIGAGVLANIVFYVPWITKQGMPMQTAWLALFGMIGFSMAKPNNTILVRGARLTCRVLLPIVVIIPAYLLQLKTYPSPSDQFPETSPIQDTATVVTETTEVETALATIAAATVASKTNKEAVPVYLFIFDMWSHARTYEDGIVSSKLPNLHTLSNQSVVFTNARSPGQKTALSIPRLLFDTNLAAGYQSGRVGFFEDEKLVSPQEFESIFAPAKQSGYKAVIVGFSLPYALWLGREVDVCRSYHWCQWYPGANWFERGLSHVSRAMRYWTDPWSQTLHVRYHLVVEARWAIRLHQQIHQDVIRTIRDLPENTFAIFHYPLPHYPYILDDRGGYRSAMDVGWAYQDEKDYEQALAALDHKVGEIIASLRNYGRFDEALLIMTSDHEWVFDPRRQSSSDHSAPEYINELRQVPLLVKLPGQKTGKTIHTSFDTRALRPLIDSAIDRSLTLANVQSIVEQAMAKRQEFHDMPAVARQSEQHTQ